MSAPSDEQRLRNPTVLQTWLLEMAVAEQRHIDGEPCPRPDECHMCIFMTGLSPNPRDSAPTPGLTMREDEAMSERGWQWSSDWRCPACGERVSIEPGQDTRPVSGAHTCNPLVLKRAARAGAEFTLDLTAATREEHECVFVEEQEPSGRLVLPPCIVCGLSAMDALAQLKGEQ